MNNIFKSVFSPVQRPLANAGIKEHGKYDPIVVRSDIDSKIHRSGLAGEGHHTC